MELSAARNTREVMSEVVKVIAAAALLAAYAMLSHWNHSDRVIASNEYSTYTTTVTSLNRDEQPGLSG